MNWPVPKFGFAEHVRVVPMDKVQGRVVDLHIFGFLAMVEYDVVYYADNRQHKIRVFEDELEKLA